MDGLRRRFLLASAERYTLIALHFVATVILARLLTPAEIGMFAVALAATNIAHSIRDFGVGRYLIQARELTPQSVRAVYGMTITIGWTMAAVLAGLAIPLAAFYDEPALRYAFWIICLNFVLIPLNAPAISILEREMAYGALFLIRVMGSISRAVLSVVLALLGFGFLGLAWGTVAAILTSLTLTMFFRPPLAWVLPTFRGWGRVASFGAKLSAANIVYDLGNGATDLVLGKLQGFASAAQFGRALSVTQVFSESVFTIVARVAFPTMAAMLREGRPVGPAYLRATAYLTGFAWPFYGFVAIMAHPLIILLFGGQWVQAVPLARVLAIAACFGALAGSLGRPALIAHGAVGTYLRTQVLTQVVRTALLVAAAFHSLEAAAWAFVVGRLVEFLAFHAALEPLIGVRLPDLLRAQWRSVVVGLAAAAVPALVVMQGPGADRPWWPLLIAGGGAAAASLAAVFAVNHPLSAEFVTAGRRALSLFRTTVA